MKNFLQKLGELLAGLLAYIGVDGFMSEKDYQNEKNRLYNDRKRPGKDGSNW